MGTESGLRRRVKGLSEAAFRERFGTGERPVGWLTRFGGRLGLGGSGRGLHLLLKGGGRAVAQG